MRLPVGKYLFGDTSKESIIEIAQGQLYLVRPQSPKGYSELIFKDAAASLRRTAQEFHYQLVVQRAYEEGEEELLAEQHGEEGAAAALGTEKDEETFLLDESLHFRSDIRPGGEKIFAWRDLDGDIGDLYEFICDDSTKSETVATFEMVAMQCQYERKFRKSREEATEKDLHQFSFSEQPIPDAHASRTASPIAKPQKTRSLDKAAVSTPTRTKGDPTDQLLAESPGVVKEKALSTAAPKVATHPKSITDLATVRAELHLFDFSSGTFILQDSEVIAKVSEVGKWQYWLEISNEKKDWLGQAVVADINPVFNFEYLSFIFNHYTADGAAYSWLLRMPNEEALSHFQEGLMQALWEQLNEVRWVKTKEEERDYVLESFKDLAMTDAPGPGDDDRDHDSESDVEDAHDGQRSEHYDTDEEADDVVTGFKDKDGHMNSQLAVGYKHDRSFVVRGSKIGVFRHTNDNRLEFDTTISKVETPKGRLFSPKKVMLHAQDSSMILQDPGNQHSLFKMDLESGKVVEEYKVHDDIPVTSFAPEKKFAQMSGEQTFLGLSRNALYKIDPRLAGNKLVDSELKQYVSKNEFSAAATTERGYIAVASNKGDIRMFDRLGINAKTHIPALGEPIIGLDVSADGRWLLATCRTYLLLLDALQKTGKFEGKLGFERSFGKDSKPQPKRLTLSPSHVAQFQHETGAKLSFTPARFNTGPDAKETSIVTATGPFIVVWSMQKVLEGRRDPYKIKRYGDTVAADNFRFGSDKNMIVALPSEVDMVRKGELRRPTRESIAVQTPRKGGRASGRLRREEVVNSPY